jgi:hypothetical protein
VGRRRENRKAKNSQLSREIEIALPAELSTEQNSTEQIPTIQLGVAASQMERKGIATDRGDINREIAAANAQIRQLRARINSVKEWLKTESENRQSENRDADAELPHGKQHH